MASSQLKKDEGTASADDRRARSRGFSHAYHEALIKDILSRAGRFARRPKRRMTDLAPQNDARETSAPRTKGDEIREKIAANAQKRVEIAEAMKAEAGVLEHELTGEHDGGIAWFDRARILAPVGENKLQLATLAHECGHVFLHAAGTLGNSLPGHVKEMEAESYAHQAFQAHGMRIPKKITKWGRHYVGTWVLSDRDAGIPIDPRAAAYALGKRSPYEPLRVIPPSWRSRMPRAEPWRKAPAFSRRTMWWARIKQAMAPTLKEAWEVAKSAGNGSLAGFMLAHIVIALPTLRTWFPGLFGEAFREQSMHHMALLILAGLLGALGGTLWRTMRRMS